MSAMRTLVSWLIANATAVGTATVGLAVNALAQGTIGLADANPAGYVDVDIAGCAYTGTFGIEVWALDATAVPAGINTVPAPGSGVAGYNAMRAAGFVLAATYANRSMTEGVFQIGAVTLPSITMLSINRQKVLKSR